MTLPALARSRSLSFFFFPLLRITLLSLHISSYLLLYNYSTRSHHSQYSQLNVVFMNGNYDFYPVTKKVIVLFKLQIFCPKTPAPPTIPDSRAIILYLRLCCACNTTDHCYITGVMRCDKLIKHFQLWVTLLRIRQPSPCDLKPQLPSGPQVTAFGLLARFTEGGVGLGTEPPPCHHFNNNRAPLFIPGRSFMRTNTYLPYHFL